MPDQTADENYIIKILIESKKAIENAQKISDMTEQIITALKKMNDESGQSFDDLIDGISKGEGTVQDLGDAFGKLSDEDMRLFNVALSRARSELKGFDDQAKDVFTVALGNIAANALQKVVGLVRDLAREFRDAIDAAGEFSMDVARLNVNLRAFQRAGGDLTASEMVDFITELGDTYTTFTEQDIVNATQEMLNWSRQLDLTGEETRQFLDLAAQQSIIMGQDLPTSVRQLSTAITTGRTQSLRPLGLAMSATFIRTEALKQELIEQGEAVTNNVKAQLILQKALETSAERNGEVLTILETLGGEQEQVIANWADMKRAVGEKFAPELRQLYANINQVVDGFKALVDSIFVAKATITAFTSSTLNQLINAWKNVWRSIRGEELVYTNFFEDFDQIFQQQMEGRGNPLETLEDTIRGSGSGAEEAIDELSKKLQDKFRDLGIDIRELLIDEQEEIEEQWEDYNQKIQDIQDKYNEDLVQQEIKFGNDLAAINRKFNDKLAEENEEYREKEEEEESDFQERLRRLRENFLLDLEDALRERDAKQVLSLIKRFNLREKQLKRQEAMEKEERRKRFQDDINDIERQRQIRIRELRFEYEERKELARRDHELRMDLEARRNQQRLADIREETRVRLEELVRRFEDEQEITTEGAKKIRDVLMEYFGPGGQVDQIYNFLVANTQAKLTAVAGAMQQMAQMAQAVAFVPEAGSLADFRQADQSQYAQDLINKRRSEMGFAEGGTLIANRPTTVTFGDKGPEAATFSPIGRVGMNENKTFVTGKGGQRGKMKIELLLSPDLEARIIDKSFSGIADVFVREGR